MAGALAISWLVKNRLIGTIPIFQIAFRSLLAIDLSISRFSPSLQLPISH